MQSNETPANTTAHAHDAADNVINLTVRRTPGAALQAANEASRQPLPPAPEHALLPDMSHANGRDVVELIAQALSQ